MMVLADQLLQTLPINAQQFHLAQADSRLCVKVRFDQRGPAETIACLQDIQRRWPRPAAGAQADHLLQRHFAPHDEIQSDSLVPLPADEGAPFPGLPPAQGNDPRQLRIAQLLKERKRAQPLDSNRHTNLPNGKTSTAAPPRGTVGRIEEAHEDSSHLK